MFVQEDLVDRQKSIVRGVVSHRSLNDAPTVAKDVSERLSTAVKGTITPGWFSESTPLVIVIVPITTTLTALQQRQPQTYRDNKLDKDLVLKSMLFDAFDLEHVIEWSLLVNDSKHEDGEEVYESEEEEENLLAAMELEQCQWPKTGSPGFCHDARKKDPLKKDDDKAEDENNIRIRKTTMIMANDLTEYFKLKCDWPMRVGPTLYGGKASDGNIVALLEAQNIF